MKQTLIIVLFCLLGSQSFCQNKQLNIAEEVTHDPEIKNNYIEKFSEIGLKNINEIFNEILIIHSEQKNTKIIVSQKVKYDLNTNVDMQFYFEVHTLSKHEILSNFNELALIYYENPEILDLKKCKRLFSPNYNFNLVLDSVKVSSIFEKFNKNFKNFIENNLYSGLSISSDSLKNINKEILSIEIMNANNDENQDILVFDIQGEKLANSLTDFWIFSPKDKDFVHLEELSKPIWKIDYKNRTFHSGWHRSANESDSYCFKIINLKAVGLKRCL